MTLTYLDHAPVLTDTYIRMPEDDGVTLQVSVHWADHANRSFSFSIEQFPGADEAAILGTHTFRCANDCDRGWDKEHLIGFYDGVHQNVYNGTITFSKSGDGYRMVVDGQVADTMEEADASTDGRIHIDVLFPPQE
ncbi:MAG: hypothetical protein H0X38_01365 [Planctomycetes bacterium]|nr:hypothetical protein [Planctomycetota bacterium]